MPEHHRGKRPPNYGRKFKPDALTRPECEALLGAFSRRGSAGIRNAAMTALMLHSGPRLGEVIKAPLRDLDLDRRTFYVRYPKRDRKGRAWPRTIGIDVETAALLERWMLRRRKLGIGPKSPLFCQVQGDRCGRPMAPSGYREALKVAAAKVGIETRVHPHGLRHTFAWHWVQDERPLIQLMAALGHRNLATTHVYVNHLNPKDMLDAMRAGRPELPAAAPDLMGMIRQAVADALAGNQPLDPELVGLLAA